jgi:ubiquitin C-terminal hydrolase
LQRKLKLGHLSQPEDRESILQSASLSTTEVAMLKDLEWVYDLVAVICWDKRYIANKDMHYVTYCLRTQDDQEAAWYSFDDELVRKVTYREVKERAATSATLVFY